ncbi:MAG: DinB family protein [Anaerolineales bacterium]|nr:DinB family protein [Anaerolineales bacterium]
MDLLDRMLAHDTWTTRQLLLACADLPDSALDREFDIDHHTLRHTFVHMIRNMEVWTDLLCERAVRESVGDSIAELLERLSAISGEFANIARKIAREGRYDDCFLDTLDNPPRLKTFGGAIGHVITHNMHHRAQVMYIMEHVGIHHHIEGDLLTWESIAFGWGGGNLDH